MKSAQKISRIQPEMISTSGAKNLKLLREQGKVQILRPDSSLATTMRSGSALQRHSGLNSGKTPGLESRASLQQSSSKLLQYMHNAKEMEQVEQIIIKPEDAKQLAKFKEESKLQQGLCTRYILREAQSRQNLKLIESQKNELKQQRQQKQAWEKVWTDRH